MQGLYSASVGHQLQQPRRLLLCLLVHEEQLAQQQGGDSSSDLHRHAGTLVVVAEVDQDLVEVLGREGLEDLVLSLRVCGDVAACGQRYDTSFFMDSMSIFFSSRGLIITIE